MKFVRNIALYSILVGIILCYSSCTKQKLFGKVTWEGHVYDKNGNPVSGIHMMLKGCSLGGDALASCKGSHGDYEIASADTDASGHFKVQGRPARNNAYYPHVGNYGAIDEDIPARFLTQTKYTVIHIP